ncbi:hypothetical protein [Fibrobacter sp.]|uniref:hypothetical protein n=1 Tax=Fibrobacter sp. TaxID=35828 RepID=UPI00388D92C4
MRLKNKETGAIVDSIQPILGKDGYSIKELNDEWEDYKPKVFYYINENGGVLRYIPSDPEGEDETYIKYQKEIGNYFEAREEAEKAVEKLKAWKRLKDKGFRFTLTPGTGSLDIVPGKFQIEINADMPAKWFCCDAVQEDLEVCFGGDE